jgi:hypothetical protein
VISMNWPSKKDREISEIEGFIDSYKKLKHGKNFIVVEEREKPDRIVQDKNTGEKFGIELTSEYLDDRSVPDRHMKNDWAYTPYNPQSIAAYEKRILKKVKDKVFKAREGYDVRYPLILSVYVNEYESQLMGEEYWRSFAKRHDKFFGSIDPFIEVVFWPLPNDLVVSVRNNNKGRGA